MAVTHFLQFNALIGLSYEIMKIMDKAMIDHLTVAVYGSIVTVYRPSPLLHKSALTSVPVACQIDRPILSNLYHRPTSNPGTQTIKPGYPGLKATKPVNQGLKNTPPPGFAFPTTKKAIFCFGFFPIYS